MTSAHKKKIKNLLKKGKLTGFEVAKIVMFQIYELEKIAAKYEDLSEVVVPSKPKKAKQVSGMRAPGQKDYLYLKGSGRKGASYFRRLYGEDNSP